MSLLVRDCAALLETGIAESVDILVVDNRIEDAGPRLGAEAAEEIDGRGQLAIPGLVNAHLHSSELPVRSRYDGLAFDSWGQVVYPLFEVEALPERLVYLRTALVALDALAGGFTCVVDDLAGEMVSPAALAAAFRAYTDVGLRACCSGAVVDRDPFRVLPYAEDELSPGAIDRLAALPFPSVEDYAAYARRAIADFHAPEGTTSFVVSPLAPQWCSDELLATCAGIAEEHDTNLLVHVLETKEQAIASRADAEGYLERLSRVGALRPGTTIAHGVWLDDADMDLLADRGCAVAHNPVANLRLGVGIAPVKELRDRGVPIGLGTDGVSIDDRADPFELMRHAALLSRTLTPDPGGWLDPDDVVWQATTGGAHCAHLGDTIGVIAPGRLADFVLLRPDVPGPSAASAVNWIVFRAGREHVSTVVVDGRVVLRDGVAELVDADELRAEYATYLPYLEERQTAIEAANVWLQPYLDRIHARCAATDIGLTRWADKPHRRGEA
jgi:5-methylthioadenosine/S-adenosylhomocysteine deaminase